VALLNVNDTRADGRSQRDYATPEKKERPPPRLSLHLEKAQRSCRLFIEEHCFSICPVFRIEPFQNRLFSSGTNAIRIGL
jgi:hypothetical protein